MALYRAAYVRSITKRPIAIACFFVIAWARVARSEGPFSDPLTDTLRVPVSRIRGPEIPSQIVDLRQGIGPDEAATIALYSNPALRAIRDRRGLVAAQLIQAGILPNPVVSYARDFVTGGNTAGTTTGYNFTAAWEFSALVAFLPKQTAARKNFRSVDLDVAWQECLTLCSVEVSPCMRSESFAIGNVMQNSVHWRSERRSVTSPLCARAISRAMLSPRPCPVATSPLRESPR